MTYYVKGSQVGFDKRFDIFSPNRVDGSIREVLDVTYRPIAAVKSSQVVEFLIPPTGRWYTDLSQLRLSVSFRLARADGAPTDDTDVCSVSNYPLASLFRNVEFCIQQKEISPCMGRNYPYKAQIDSLLFKSPEGQQSSLQAAGFFPDTAGVMDSVEVEGCE